MSTHGESWEATAPVDEPAPTILDQPRWFAGRGEMLARGSELLFTGMGGDHVLRGHPAQVLRRPAIGRFVAAACSRCLRSGG